MAILEIQKVKVVALHEQAKLVLKTLQKYGVFENTSLVSSQTNTEIWHQMNKQVMDLEFVINYLDPYFTEKRPWQEFFFAKTPIYDLTTLVQVAETFNFQSVVDQVRAYESRLNVMQIREQEVRNALNEIYYYQNLTFKMSDFKKQKTLALLLANLKKTDFPFFGEELAAITDQFKLGVLHENKVRTYFYVLIHHDYFPELKSLAEKYQASTLTDFPYNDFKQSVLDYEAELSLLNQERQEIDRELKKIAQKSSQLKACHDYYAANLQCEESYLKSEKSQYLTNFSGFIEKSALDKLNSEIAKLTKNQALIIPLELEEGETPPVEIKNRGFAPFELITRLFGLPQAHEVDPSAYLSIFFLVFFGFCITDAIYGALIALLTGFILFLFRLPKETKQMVLVLFYGGLATIVMGALFGGYASIDLKYLPDFFSQLKMFDINTEVNKVLGLAFGLGLLHLLFGTLIAGTHLFKQKKYAEAICKHYIWTIALVVLGIS
ncbi:MAG TPA: hypothetical protein PLQ36_01270, partial [Candidatus Gracilibacteria bacterium]|nr:hypothetical protein [Candidatus Gracilibacteria bacterium]